MSNRVKAVGILLILLSGGVYAYTASHRVGGSAGTASTAQGNVAHASASPAFMSVASPDGRRSVELHALGSMNPLNASYDLAVDLVDGSSVQALPSVPGVWPWLHRAEVSRWIGPDRVLLGWRQLHDVRRGNIDLKSLISQAAGAPSTQDLPVWSWSLDPSGSKLAVLAESGPEDRPTHAVIVVVDLANLTAQQVVSQPLGTLRIPEEGWRSLYWSKDGSIFFDGISDGDYTLFRWNGKDVQPVASGVVLNGISPDGLKLSVLRPNRADHTVDLQILGLDGAVLATTPVNSAPLTWWDDNGERLAAYDATTREINVWRLDNSSLVKEMSVQVNGERVAGVSDIRFNGKLLQFTRWGTNYDPATDTFRPDVAPVSVALP